MRSWVFRAIILAAALGVPVLWSQGAAAQLSFVAPASTASNEIVGYLEQGRVYESDRRWSEALSHYENALRNHPHDPHLEQRFTLVRFHYDLGRRYGDNSYRNTLSTLPARDALDLYVEVLLKVQSHYVDTIDWKQLIDHGTSGFEVALSDPVFLQHNLPQVDPQRIERFRNELRSRLGEVRIDATTNGRAVARDTASLAAQLARQDLGLLESATLMEYVCGAANSLDHYSTYLTSGQLGEVYSQIEGNFVGLGIELRTSGGMLEILKVIARSPAERAGIRAGDQIVAVDGRNVAAFTTDQAANLLQGAEGTIVQVTVVTPGQRPRMLNIRREQIEVPSIDGARILDETQGIAYLKLTCFQKTTSRDLDDALWRLHRQGMRSLIIDLRGNPGGLLTTSVDVVDRFVDRGVIVSTRGRNAMEDYSYSAHQAGTWRVPLIVLIDGDSASASEIFAGAIRDHGRGTIVGSRSYGKGSVQGIFPLNVSNSGLRLTTAKFYSPKGLAYSDVGVAPDLVVHETARPVISASGNPIATASTSDAALDAAVKVARQEVASR